MSSKAIVVIVLVSALAVLGSSVGVRANDGEGSSKLSWTLGVGTPSGEASDYYGNTWINLRGSYRLSSAKTSELYFGGGVGLLYLNTQATYDAGEGYVWTATGERELSLKQTDSVLAPHLAVGYRVKNNLAIELGVTIANAKLAGNTSEHRFLPPVPDVKLGTLFTLSVDFRR